MSINSHRGILLLKPWYGNLWHCFLFLATPAVTRAATAVAEVDPAATRVVTIDGYKFNRGGRVVQSKSVCPGADTVAPVVAPGDPGAAMNTLILYF